MERHRRPRRVLVVEDNPGDAMFICEVLTEQGLAASVEVARDGREALAVLHRLEAEGVAPDLITLDLNLSFVGGLEVLAAIRDSQLLGMCPVVVLSTSDAPGDVTAAYRGHANGYLTKPATARAFTEAIEQLGRYWLQCSQLPPPVAGGVRAPTGQVRT